MKYDLKTLTEAFIKHVEYHHAGVIYATEETVAADKPTPDVVYPTVLLSQAEVDDLGVYDHSLPTGTRIGKRWKKSDGKGGWKMGEYINDPNPKMVGIQWSTIRIIDQSADQPAGDDAITVSYGTHAHAVRYAEQMTSERDKALAELAAEREFAVKRDAERSAEIRTLKGLTERAEKAEAEIVTTRQALGDALGKDYLSAESAVAALTNERDAARAEVDALKQQLQAILDDAICAAGVEVEP